MRCNSSFKLSLQRSGIFLASGLTLVGTSTFAVKADETPIVESATILKETPHAVETAVPPAEPTAHITSNKSTSPREISIKRTDSGSISSKNQYIDINQYEIQPKEVYGSPSKVIISERRSKCRTIIDQGRLIKGECTLSSSPATVTPVVNSELTPKRERSVSLQINPRQFTRRLRPPVYVASISPRIAYETTVSFQQPFNTVPLNGAYPQLGLEAVPLEYSRATTNVPLIPSAENRTSLIFPLAIPAAISSAFGWRIHPITGTSRMHTGTDIAAPLGTPVLAAYPGQVETAGWTNGYGLMIALQHENNTQESRYAHLSEIYVQPGEWVEQGTVIGKVGSTGFSTGPHLHFEWRHLSAAGSIPVDAGAHIQYALNNLIYSLQRAQATTLQPQG